VNALRIESFQCKNDAPQWGTTRPLTPGYQYMENIEKVIAGAAGGIAFIGFIWRNLNCRMNRLEDNTVFQQVCDERHRRIDEKLEEMKQDLKEIKADIRDLPMKINGK